MKKIVTITRQGQLTIPKEIRQRFALTGSAKASITVKGDVIVVQPKANFWSLGGSLHSSVKLTDAQMKKARKSFEGTWARKV